MTPNQNGPEKRTKIEQAQTDRLANYEYGGKSTQRDKDEQMYQL